MKLNVPQGLDETSTKKFKELILYISWKSETDESFGAIKLNKILFFADFMAYARYGKSISGQEYQKLLHGPAPRRLVPVRRELEESGDLAIRIHNFFGQSQKKTFALRMAELGLFSPDEIALVDEVIEECQKWNGKDVSDVSHNFVGWRVVGKGETIPYKTALIGSRALTDGERQYGASLTDLAKESLAAHV